MVLRPFVVSTAVPFECLAENGIDHDIVHVEMMYINKHYNTSLVTLIDCQQYDDGNFFTSSNMDTVSSDKQIKLRAGQIITNERLDAVENRKIKVLQSENGDYKMYAYNLILNNI